MCFGDSDLVGAREPKAARSMIGSMKLKRRRSPTGAAQVEPQDSRKLSKLDSTASTLANKQQTTLQKPSSVQEPPSQSPPPAVDANDAADNTSVRIEQLQSLQSVRESTSISSESTLSMPSIPDCTPLEQRTALIEAQAAHEAPHSYTYQHFAGLKLYPAIRFELKRSTKINNSELAACFDLISKTSQQDYKSSSLGWDPDYKMEEMTHKEMMYLLVRQADGYMGIDKVSGQGSDVNNAGALLGFLSFKLEPEDEEHHKMRPVQFIYEIHLDDRLRGQGLGGRMLRWAEGQARLVNISKTMLTVFTVNEGARRLYEKEGFVKDGLTPPDRVTRRKIIKADYMIMSKEL